MIHNMWLTYLTEFRELLTGFRWSCATHFFEGANSSSGFCNSWTSDVWVISLQHPSQGSGCLLTYGVVCSHSLWRPPSSPHNSRFLALPPVSRTQGCLLRLSCYCGLRRHPGKGPSKSTIIRVRWTLCVFILIFMRHFLHWLLLPTLDRPGIATGIAEFKHMTPLIYKRILVGNQNCVFLITCCKHLRFNESYQGGNRSMSVLATCIWTNWEKNAFSLFFVSLELSDNFMIVCLKFMLRKRDYLDP